MDELQDLASALEESELKKDIDDVGDVSATSPRPDRDLQRKRRTRKRRTTSTSTYLVSSLINNLVVNQTNTSPRSSSSWDEVVKDYVESFTANCSDESDEYVSSLKSRLQNAVLSNNLQVRGHHKRVFKQATPCCCESDSYTENGSALPVLRRHRKKKIKRMTIDSNCHGDGLLRENGDMTLDGTNTVKRKKKGGTQRKEPCDSGPDKMACKTTKLKREKTVIPCLLCSQKSCDKLQAENSVRNGPIAIQGTKPDESDTPGTANLPKPSAKSEEHGCQCRCHVNRKDESSISSTSSNSDTDSANFTQDDAGGDGDDEMTDFYAESENGPVWGVPNVCGMRWWPHGLMQRNTAAKEDALCLHKMDINDINCTNHFYDNKVKRFVSGSVHMSECSRRGFHARNNRLPGMAARSIRRGRRRAKMKKSKEKSAREQDLLEFQSSLSKLSLSARNKRIKLEDNFWKEAYSNRNDWTHRLFQTCPSSVQVKGGVDFATMEMKSPANTATKPSNEDTSTKSSFSEAKQ